MFCTNKSSRFPEQDGNLPESLKAVEALVPARKEVACCQQDIVVLRVRSRFLAQSHTIAWKLTVDTSNRQNAGIPTVKIAFSILLRENGRNHDDEFDGK